MIRTHTSRRRVLQLLAGAGGATLMSSVVASDAGVPLPVVEALLAVLSSREGARAIGALYLEAVPGEASAGQLVHLIAGSAHGAHMTPSAAQTMLLDAVRRDFERFETIELDGWVVSRTEARLCALAALG